MFDAWLKRTMALILCVKVLFCAEEISAVSPVFIWSFLVDHPPLYMRHITLNTFTVSSKVVSLLLIVIEMQLFDTFSVQDVEVSNHCFFCVLGQ